MPGFGSSLVPMNDYDDSTTSAYNMLYLFAGLVTALCVILTVVAEKNNRLKFDNPVMRIIADILILMMTAMHLKRGDLPLTEDKMQILAIGPHRTGFEGIAVTAKMQGTPPRFFATTHYNSIPLVSGFLKMCKVIPVEANAQRGTDGRSANSKALDIAGEALEKGDCIGIFPQGSFVKKGEKIPKVYSGAAELAVKHNKPIHVLRLDGFWCLENPVIPLFIRNNSYYRAFISAFHPNNIRINLCCVIDFHLKPENKHLKKEEKVEEINAQLYAYFRHIEELTDTEIDEIKKEISDKTHLTIWRGKVELDAAERRVKELTTTQIELEKPKGKVKELTDTQTNTGESSNSTTLSRTM